MRKIKPATSNNSRTVITTKARVSGWAVETSPTNEAGAAELTFTRDNWKIVVACNAQSVLAAMLQYPGQPEPSTLLRAEQMSRYLRGNRAQMSAFHLGQRVVCGGQVGTVQDITPEDEVKVQLTLRYDDGSVGEPFTTHVQPEDASRGIAKYDRVQLDDGTLGVVVLADDHNALLVRPDRSETSTTVAADSVTRLFGAGDEVMANGLVRRVVSYTRNQSYRLRHEESDTVCDFYAWDITPASEGAAA